jgi:hypothetical protein
MELGHAVENALPSLQRVIELPKMEASNEEKVADTGSDDEAVVASSKYLFEKTAQGNPGSSDAYFQLVIDFKGTAKHSYT